MAPRIEITGLGEAEVNALSEMLVAEGLEHDVDFTTLYGREWDICGIRAMTAPAMSAVAHLIGR